MSNYKGQLEGFPTEIVEMMLDRQEEQGNERDVSVFEKYKKAGKLTRGFTWKNTREGEDFWNEVVYKENFDVFFKKYPKRLFTIEDLRNGKCAVINDGTKEELHKILRITFETNVHTYTGSSKFYRKQKLCNNWWGDNTTSLPAQSIKDFIKQLDMQQETFPKDDFGVIVETNNGKEIVDYLISKGFNANYNKGDAINGSHYCILKNNNNIKCSYNNPTSKTYTLQQLKNLDTMENRKHIGYKLIKIYPGSPALNSIFFPKFRINRWIIYLYMIIKIHICSFSWVKNRV